MNWSSKWNDDNLDPVEAAKVEDDTIMFGTGYHKDGKHVPAENVYIQPTINVTDTTNFMVDGSIEQYRSLNIDGKKIKVEIIGDLALAYEDDGWTLFHVPTLQVCSKLVPGKLYNPDENDEHHYDYSREALLTWMKKVQESHKGYWASLAQLTPKNHSGMQLTKDLLLAYCLSVPVEE